MSITDKIKSLEQDRRTLERLFTDNDPGHPNWNEWHQSYWDKGAEIAELKREERENH